MVDQKLPDSYNVFKYAIGQKVFVTEDHWHNVNGIGIIENHKAYLTCLLYQVRMLDKSVPLLELREDEINLLIEGSKEITIGSSVRVLGSLVGVVTGIIVRDDTPAFYREYAVMTENGVILRFNENDIAPYCEPSETIKVTHRTKTEFEYKFLDI